MKRVLLLLLLTATAAAQTATPVQTASIGESPAPEALAPVPAAPTPTTNPISALPAGTEMKVKLDRIISTATNKAGDRFSAHFTAPVTYNGQTIVPAGAALEGRIARATERRRIWGTPTIDLRPDTIIMPNGNRFSVSAAIVDTSSRPDVDVNDEGKLKGRGHDGSDWKETGIMAGGAALGGGLIAGGEGALIGAGVGATASVVHWLVKTRTATLPAGTELVLELSHPMSIGGDAQ